MGGSGANGLKRAQEKNPGSLQALIHHPKIVRVEVYARVRHED